MNKNQISEVAMSQWKYFKQPYIDKTDTEESVHMYWEDRILKRLIELGDKEFVKEAKRFREEGYFWYA